MQDGSVGRQTMNYAGMTFGPVTETLSATYTPAGLWFSSYFFSRFVGSCAMDLQKKGYEIITLKKGYDFGDDLEDKGVGKYHDRIYFRGNKTAGEIRKDIESTKSEVIDENAVLLADGFEKAGITVAVQEIQEFFNRFLQIHYAVFSEDDLTAKGVSKTMADTLDALELSQSISSEPGPNYLFRFAEGDPYKGSNDYLRHYSPLMRASREKAFRIATGGEKVRIRDIGYISSNGKYTSKEIEENNYIPEKTEKYFAIVQCDGDNMGKLISGTSGKAGCKDSLDEQVFRIQDFSSKCMEYADRAYQLISNGGGFLIYAGGDDLLFLSPVISGNTNVWELCRDIAAEFDRIFNPDGSTGASLSFGISVNYYKFPLYEAFQDALSLLFGEAKSFVRGREKAKNNAAIKIHKASGQSMGVVFCMDTRGKADQTESWKDTLFQHYLDLTALFAGADKKTDSLMTSILYHIENQKSLFTEALGNGLDLSVLLENVFDGPVHGEAEKMIAVICELILSSWKASLEHKLKALGGDGPIDAVTGMLRMAKFLVEE